MPWNDHPDASAPAGALPALGERNIPDVANHQKVPLVEQAAGAFRPDVSGVLTLATTVVRGIGRIIDQV